MLPASRNRTYVDGSPIIAGDLNDLQDAVISAKHGELSFAIWAPDFHGKDIAFDYDVGWASSSVDGANRYAQTSLRLPAGRRLVSVQFFYDRGGNGTVGASIIQKRPSTGGHVTAWSAAGDAVSSGVQSHTIAPSGGHVIVDGDAYLAQFLVTHISNRLYGAKVIFDAP